MKLFLFIFFFIPCLGEAFVAETAVQYLCPETDWVFPCRRDKALSTLFPSYARSVVIGAQYLPAVGLAHGIKLKGETGVVYVSGGDGSIAQGDFYEALNYAAFHKLAVIFVIHDDGWANGVPTPLPATSIAQLSQGRSHLEITTTSDPSSFSKAIETAVTRGRKNQGPSLIIVKLPPPQMIKQDHVVQNKPTQEPHVLVLGQNVTQEWHTFINTPLAESTIAGVALGLSLDHFHRPIAKIQEGEFLWLAMHQIREIARLRAPLILRLPYGAYGENPATALMQFPNLKILLPSNASDAKALLKSAVEEAGPVIFLEHPFLYTTSGVDYHLPLNQAAIAQNGTDLTLVTWGAQVKEALEVTRGLSEKLSVEVIDLRILQPFDLPTCLTSLQKTKHLIVIGDAPLISAEIMAQISEEKNLLLKQPSLRFRTVQEFALHIAKNI